MKVKITSAVVLIICAAAVLTFAATPTPTPKPKKKPFFSWLPPAKSTPTPKPAPKSKSTAKPKAKSTASPKGKSATPKSSASPHSSVSPTPTVTPSATPSPTSTPEPTASPSATESPTPQPALDTTPASSETASPTPATDASPAAESTPLPDVSSTSGKKYDLTLVKYEPAHGSPGEESFRGPRLTYRLTTGQTEKLQFPVIDFAVETSSGKLFQRHFELPPDSPDMLEPGEGIDRIVSLDPTFADNWADLYKKSEHANFTWSIGNEVGGAVEKPVHKPWP